MEDKPNKRILKSFPFHGEKCWFVSTIERTYDLASGTTRGLETLVWEYDWDLNERGAMIWQGGGLEDHFEVVKSIINTGKIPEKDE